MYDKFQVLAMQAHDSLCLCILANDDITDLELVNAKIPVPDDTAREFDARQLRFLGMVGLVDGVPQTALEIPLDSVRVAALSAAFVAYCKGTLRDALEMGDEVGWLMRLFSLPDERPEV